MATSNNSASKTSSKTSANSIKPRTKKIIKRLWIIFAALVACAVIFFIMAYNGLVGYMPPIEELKNPQDKFASVVYTADGVEIGRYFRSTGNRVYADFDEISPNVINALIATEDSRFRDHSGIDARALTRVAVKTLLLQQKNAGGGSTITQQLAKQLYTPPSSSLLSRALSFY